MREKKPRRRHRGEGGLYQRCEKQYGCPAMETVKHEDGTTERVRPEHTCKGLWIGAVDLGWVNGRRQRATVSAKTQMMAAKKMRDLKDTLAKTGGHVPERRLTVGQWLTYWLDEICPRKPNTHRFHETNINVHLIPAIGHIRMNRLSTDDVRRMHKTVMAKQWRGKNVSSTTAMHVHGTLRTALDAAVREQPPKADRNVAELVKPPARSTADRGALTSVQARTLITHRYQAGDPMWTRWTQALFTGSRQGESLGLEWDRVDLEGGVLDLSWGLDELPFRHGCGTRDDGDDGRWPCGRKRAGSCPERELDVPPDYEYRQLDGRLCLVRLKSEASKRIIPIVAPLHVALTVRRAEYVTQRDRYDPDHRDHGLVWCRPDGRPIVGKDDSAAWKAACKAAGVPVLDLHAARHTTATLLLDAGVDTRIIQQIVGHSKATTTHAYQHVDIELARRGLQAMVNLIGLELPHEATPRPSLG